MTRFPRVWGYHSANRWCISGLKDHDPDIPSHTPGPADSSFMPNPKLEYMSSAIVRRPNHRSFSLSMIEGSTPSCRALSTCTLGHGSKLGPAHVPQVSLVLSHSRVVKQREGSRRYAWIPTQYRDPYCTHTEQQSTIIVDMLTSIVKS